MFFKVGVLKNFVTENFCNIHSKTPVLESLFNKVAGLKVCNFIKKSEYCEIFKNNFFYRTPSVAASAEL